MFRSWSVARFAANTQLGEGRGVTIGIYDVVFFHSRRVTVRAHVIPVIRPATPMERIGRGNRFPGPQVEPSLPALVFGSGIPGECKGLQPTVSSVEQVLLQRLNAKGVFDRKLCLVIVAE